MVELSSFSARTFKSLEVPTLPLSSAPAASSRKRHSYGGSTRHPSQASVPQRRCVSWSPGGERVKVQLVLRPPTLSQAARLDFHSSRTFGGIHRKVRLNLPTAEERQDFASWTESFSKSTRRQRYVVAFVNSRSGGQTGSLIMKTLQASLSPDAGQQEKMRGEVCDLSREGEPEATIRGLAERLKNEPRDTLDMRLLVCGGDGTVTWILTALDNCRELEDDLDRVPVGIVPLGTGNDLARSLGWGPKLSKVSDILEYLKLIAEAEPVDLDQWRIVLRPHAELPADHKLRTCGSHPQPVRDTTLAAQLRRDMRKALNSVAPDNGAEEAESSESKELFLGFWQNYFSIGVDAKVTFHVDLQRSHTDCGRRCFSWGCGKLCYAWQAVLHALGAPALLQQIPSLKVAPPDYDADALQDLSMGPEAFRQLMFVNINSYAAGQQVQPQPDDALRPPAPGDGLIEVLTVSSVTEGIAMFTGCGRPRYVTTGEELAFSVSGGQCMQLDGEPWRLDVGCDVLIEPNQRVHMLLAPGSGRYWRGHITPEFWATSSQEPRPRCSTIAERDEDFDECSPFR